MDLQTFIRTVETMIWMLNYEELPPPFRENINRVLGFKPLRRNGVNAARRILETGEINGFTAQAGDYHVRPLDIKKRFTPDEGWVVASDIFNATYEWLPGEPGLGNDFSQCRKKVPTWVYDTSPYMQQFPVYVQTLEGSQKIWQGDWLAIGVKGEMWPIPKEKHADYERL